MDNPNLEQEYLDLFDEVQVGSIADHELQITEFFRLFSSLSAENGDTPDLDYCPILGEGTRRYRIDGYALDIVEGDSSESGDLYLAVCDYRKEEALTVMNARDIDRLVDLATRFYSNVSSDSFLDALEEASPAYQLAALIRQFDRRLDRIRVIIFTNAHLKTRKNVFETRELNGKSLHTNVLDLERYVKISTTGGEPVEIDFIESFGKGIECLCPPTDSSSYNSYLLAISGDILAEIFGAYGNRLLEQNVRTYLQARTNVNKGILKTIAEEPEMFFAYNNGITATASAVQTIRGEGGSTAIRSLQDFQIVNGGQTTASLLYARDAQKRNLDQVHVQMKLSVVDPEKIDIVVPKISEYANTQNKVSLADLASNSPVQIQIERLSKEANVPQKAGDLHSKKWFYERTRGQYRSLFAYKTPSERKKLELEYPRDHLITKTDLAKFEYSFDGQPHVVSLGAQKCFLKFTGVLSQIGKGDALALNELWFKRAIAKSILFKSLDGAIQKAEWYKEDRGYKAQIVTYTIAACADGFRRKGHQIDLDKIWAIQEVPGKLLDWILQEARKVSSILKDPPENVRNISEYAKKAHCWEGGVSGNAGIPEENELEFGISLELFGDAERSSKGTARQNKEVDFDLALVKLIPRAQEIRAFVENAGMQSPKNMSALGKLAAGKFNLNKGEKNALKLVLDRLEIEY